ncbi:recombinase family protein [Sporosarcina ureilytica]|uniref:Resolvase/invertase-type recombinase catalytic domain-containing protein n=1 Tax=Sporosarcina ureilytica TaxID=298596 RepID=A0A1D8JFS8_9BACL|nr:recombinase family protein [Sporosarcina ureilytica]AOV07566.1 hypothetical protein BI350_08485 [Sporosarcina ureilytica]
MNYGYMRPIVRDPLMQKQLISIETDQLFTESHAFAQKRAELENLFMSIQKGDKLFVQNIETLADSLHHFLDILRLAKRDEITIHFLDEKITNQHITEGSLLTWAEFFTELQSTFLSHTSTFAIQAAKQRGKTIGRPRKSDDNLNRAFAMYQSKQYTLHQIKEETGISKSTLYRYLDSKR